MRRFLPILVLTLLIGPAGRCPAQSSSSAIDRVEEDWELVVGIPDLVGAGPQITTTMCPTQDPSQGFIVFNINYRNEPFRAGGLQLMAWSDSVLVADSVSPRTSPLNTPGETITWTQQLSVANGQLTMKITSAQSTTWGNFATAGGLQVVMSSPTATLDSYSPDVSVQFSGVSWQSNLVTRMRLLRVRYYSNNELIQTDQTTRPIALGN